MVSCTGFNQQTQVDSVVEVEKTEQLAQLEPTAQLPEDSIKLVHYTFLGNQQRNFNGENAPKSLDESWKLFLGEGLTNVPGKGMSVWKGAGWTGQPLIVEEKGRPYIIQGCYDHTLKKIDLQTGKVIWKYQFDDVLKGTGTIWRNRKAKDPKNSIVILQGSRRGAKTPIYAKKVYSFRAISYFTGKELWRMNSVKSGCYSRDVDASAVVIGDTAYVPLENGFFKKFNPVLTKISIGDSIKWNNPVEYATHQLFTDADLKAHRGNIVTEASPTRLGNRLYMASGSGHIYGYNFKKDTVDWDFYIGSDMDGSCVVTSDSCLLVTIEKQYIKGNGGLMKIDPRKTPDSSVVWFYPTPNKGYAEWKGGVIGSCAVNDRWVKNKSNKLAAFNAIDGSLYVVKHQELTDSLTYGPNRKHKYPVPKLHFKVQVGPSISTPIFVQNKILTATYKKLAMFAHDSLMKFKLEKEIKGRFEATPNVYKGQVFVASRNGYLYCFGKSEQEFKPYVEPILPKDTQLLAANSVPETSLNDVAMVEVEKKEIETKTEEVVNSTEITSISKPISKPIVKTKPKKEPEKEVVTKPTVAPSKNNTYHLIAGAFGVDGNAEKLKKQLAQKGIQSTVLPKTGKMTYVSVFSANSREALKSKQATFKSKFGISSWVLKR